MDFCPLSTRQFLAKNGKIGAFILRFSESCLGCIGPYVLTNRGVEPREVYNTKKLKAVSLAEYVMKQSELKFLIPSGATKEDTFGKYWQGMQNKGLLILVSSSKSFGTICRHCYKRICTTVFGGLY